MFPPNPRPPPLKVIYSHVAINDKLEVKMKSEEVRTAKLHVEIRKGADSNIKSLSLRGATDLVATWQSRGSALIDIKKYRLLQLFSDTVKPMS